MPSNYARPGAWTVSSSFYFLCFGVSLLFVFVFFSGSRSLTAKHIACRFSTTYLHRDEKSCWFDFFYKVYICRFSMIRASDQRKKCGLNPGATHNFEKNLLRVRWSEKDALLAAGSACQNVPPAWHFSNIFQSSKLGCEKTATHACTVFLKVLARWIFGTWRCSSSLTGPAIVCQKRNRCSMVQYFYTDSLLVISWNLSLTKGTSILSQQKMWHLKLCFFPWNMKTTLSLSWWRGFARLPGHTGSVNEVCFHPKEPIIASVASDRTGELRRTLLFKLLSRSNELTNWFLPKTRGT